MRPHDLIQTTLDHGEGHDEMQWKTWTAIAISCAYLGRAAATGAQETPAPTPLAAEPTSTTEAAAEALTEEERAVYERLVALDASLEYQFGEVPLGDGLATLTLPDTLRYMDPENTERLLVEGWGNPAGGGTLGMIVPAEASPLSGDSWGVVISYDEDGYVSDEDADGIDYDAMLEEMQAVTKEENAVRAEQGFEQVELVGWAERPRYEKESRKLFWAKELAFEGNPSNTLNYNVRVLGRRGVIGAAEFDEGHRYADYQPGTDEVAAYGLAALVAGGIAAKSGLLTKLLALALAGKKLLIPALIALVAGGGSWLRRRGSREASASAIAPSTPKASPSPTAPPIPPGSTPSA